MTGVVGATKFSCKWNYLFWVQLSLLLILLIDHLPLCYRISWCPVISSSTLETHQCYIWPVRQFQTIQAEPVYHCSAPQGNGVSNKLTACNPATAGSRRVVWVKLGSYKRTEGRMKNWSLHLKIEPMKCQENRALCYVCIAGFCTYMHVLCIIVAAKKMEVQNHRHTHTTIICLGFCPLRHNQYMLNCRL